MQRGSLRLGTCARTAARLEPAADQGMPPPTLRCSRRRLRPRAQHACYAPPTACPPAGLRDERDLSIAVRLGCGAVAGTMGQVGWAGGQSPSHYPGAPCQPSHRRHCHSRHASLPACSGAPGPGPTARPCAAAVPNLYCRAPPPPSPPLSPPAADPGVSFRCGAAAAAGVGVGGGQEPSRRWVCPALRAAKSDSAEWRDVCMCFF